MSWQAITKEKNLDISVIGLSALEENTRIDAEYYRPEYLLPYRKGLELRPIGNVLTKCQYGISQAMNEEGIGIEIYRMNDLESGLCKDSDLKYVDIDEQKAKLYRLKPKDILFNRVNSIQFVGRTAIYKHENRNRVFASYLIRLNTNEKEILPDYLNIFLNCKYGRKEITRKARWAVNQANVNAEELKRIDLPVASVSLQKRIEDFINQAHSLSTKARETYNEAEHLLLKEIGLVDYQPSKKNISIRSLSESLINSRIDAEYWQPDFDKIQNTIKERKDGFDTLNNLFELSEKKARIELETEYFYAELADVNSASGTIDNFTVLLGKELPSRGRMALKKNDITISSVEGSLEKVALVLSSEKNIIGSTGFFVLRQKAYEPEVALVLLKSKPIQQLLKRQAQGTILAAIPKTSLSRVLLPKINLSVQKQIKQKIAQSHTERQEAKDLLEKAKRAVEIFIEEDEEQAFLYLNK